MSFADLRRRGLRDATGLGVNKLNDERVRVVRMGIIEGWNIMH